MLRLECPICEHRFSAKKPATLTNCPECKRKFSTSSAIVDDEPSPKLPTTKAAPGLPPKQILKVPKPELSRVVREASNQDEPTSDTQPKTAPIDDTEEGVFKNPKRTYSKKPNKILPLATLIILAMIAGALLTYLPIALRGSGELAENSGDSTITEVDRETATSAAKPDDGDTTATTPATLPESTSETTPPETVSNSEAQPTSSDVEVPSGEPKLSLRQQNAKEAPIGKQNFYTEKQFRDFWRENQNRIVRLEITNSLGKHLALGTIVDSRGWIATSFRAVAGASKVRVTQTMESFESFRDQEPLTDLCRGVIASDPAHDLVILAINTRFVFINSELVIASDDNVMGTDHFIQFGFFDETMPIALRETQAVERASTANVEQKTRQFFEKTFLNSDDLRWIQHVNREGAVPGSPLFSVEGVLTGINTASPDSDKSFAIHTEHLAKLLGDIPFDEETDGGRNPLDLAVLDRDLEKVGMEVRDKQMMVDEASPVRPASVKLNLAGKKCASFNWVPNNEAEYVALQDFAKQMLDLTFYSMELAVDTDGPNFHRESADKKKLQLQIKTWQERLLGHLFQKPLRTPETMERLNRYSAKAVKSASPENDPNVYQVSYVKVNLTAMDSPRPAGSEPTVTLNIDGTEQFLNVPFDDRLPAMLPETVWLAIYLISEEGDLKFVHPQTKQDSTARQGQILMIQGPLK